MPTKAAPATTSMPVLPSSCARCNPAGLPAGKVADGSAAHALDKNKADETTKDEITKRACMMLLRIPFGKSEEAETVPRQIFTATRRVPGQRQHHNCVTPGLRIRN
jgi:hypothetical protein